jgi:putative PEP-CTERM system histidine kinase
MPGAGLVLALAALTSLALVGATLGRRPRGRMHWAFALGMVGLALEAAAGLVLLVQTESPEERLTWLRVLQATSLLVVMPWGVFVATLARERNDRPPRWLSRLLVGAGALVIGGAVAVLVLPAFQVSPTPGTFHAARLEGVGRAGALLQLLATVGILAGLEAAFRGSRGEARWRTKYLVLGLGGAFLVRFYFLSQLVLFNVLMAAYVASVAATQVIANVVVGVALARDRLGTDVAVSRQVVYRSIAVAVLGAYLVAVGVLGWLLTYLGVPEELFWGSVVVFVSALGLATALLSETVRWRVKRLIATHFYRSKYDYRLQWINFTKRLGSLLTVDELAPALLGAVTETVGATAGILYLADPRDGRYRPVAVAGLGRPRQPVGDGSPLLGKIRTAETPLVVGRDCEPGWLDPLVARVLGAGAVVVPLQWHGELTGLLLVGVERTGAAYGVEDLEFLATAAEQAAGAIVTAQLSERLAQAREFEAFHRLTSFVIHDLKNSMSALSMLSQNALQHFDDPEFQRDAIQTLARTVDRMRALLSRLAAPDAAALQLQPVDLAALALEVVRPIAGSDRISLIKDLAPVPPIPGDPEALLRVIQNLVANAVQAVEGEGTVTVRTCEEDGRAVLFVADTGRGMSEEFMRTALFVPFRSRRKGGWGIGLYQSKSIVEAHGGAIEVESRVGVGTTFRVSLPVTSGGRA